MSQAQSKKKSPELAEAARQNRARRRARIAQGVTDLRAWREERRIQSQKRQAKAAKARRAAEYGHRGVDRVPDRILDAPTVTVEVFDQMPLGTSTLPDGRVTTGNYADRRARGARGKPRRLRAREMPGAVARRAARAEA